MPRRREPTGRQRACTHMHAAMEGWGTLPSQSWNEAARMLRHAASAPESAINHSLHSFQNQTARAHTRASAPNSIRCSGNRGMGARGTVQSTRTHVWSSFGRDKLQSLFNDRNSCPSLSRAKSSAWVVAAGRLLCIVEPRTPARVFSGPAHRTLGDLIGVCSTIQSSLHTFFYYDEQPR